MISLMRVDDRLVHGQVAYGWTSTVDASVILVVNDEAKNDKVRAMALNMAKPSNVKLYIRGVEESGEIVKKFAESKKNNVLVIVKNINDAHRLINISEGVVNHLNIGGLPHQEGKTKLMDLVSISEQELEQIREIEGRGVEVEFRMLPRDRRRTLNQLTK
ncbi:PTS system, mannose-specific IIB component [Amphibacillus marinus]|uniref:PTS system, mannose-specific IIB component n=1 Tax=Amphibacillus marinus TaxID=872970 RepID=A0A1H8IXB4_9BACI|nr:PTS sugar transporter subunit IIB [Amphibacillus marinus]SEN72989.1 PTS system, mannose-specific IIB component [Amphibacillus marinus]